MSTYTLLEKYKKNVEHESDSDINSNWSVRYSH